VKHTNVLEKGHARRLADVQDRFEAVTVAVVRVWNLRVFR
jgi:hypothetical protein